MSREQRAALAAETLAVLEKGEYQGPLGDWVCLGPAQEKAEQDTVTFSEDAVYSLRENLAMGTSAFQTSVELVAETTMACAQRVIWEDKEDSVLALNFASARNPGGGFLKGSQAQEETLARSSGLYPCLKDSDYYRFNRGRRGGLYSDMMIYSPEVPFFRSDRGDFLASPYLLSVITSPAVNAGVIRKQEPKNRSKIVPVMRKRCALILSVARHYGHTTFILGAWGCGVFRNDPKQVAEIFKDVLESEEFQGVFRRVLFAIPIFGKDRTNYAAFEQVFRSR